MCGEELSEERTGMVDLVTRGPVNTAKKKKKKKKKKKTENNYSNGKKLEMKTLIRQPRVHSFAVT